MSETAEKLKTALLELPEGERIAIANMLYDSVPEKEASALRVELDRRRVEHESGVDHGIPADEFFRKLREKRS